MSNCIWITWETQRRSIELARKFGCTLYLIEKKGIFRYPYSFFATIFVFLKKQPDFLFVQNPSMILASLACIFGVLSKTFVVVDRHTTFRLKKPHSGTFRIWLFMRLHYFTLKWADLTIVTNDYLANLVRKAGGNAFVLPDMLPMLEMKETKKLKGKINLLLISSFGLDEPISEVIDAMKAFIKEDVYLYISGNFKKINKNLLNSAPPNVVFTGFLPDQEFVDILFSVDLVLVLTTSDYCMLCGCYEAISAEKPLITSNKSVLKNYFNNAIFVENTKEDIYQGIHNAIRDIPQQIEKTRRMKENIELLWKDFYQNLEIQLEKELSEKLTRK